MDWDEFHYRLRLMALRRGLDDARLVMIGGALGPELVRWSNWTGDKSD